MGKSPLYLSFLLMFFVAFYGIHWYQKTFLPAPLTYEIQKPDLHLENSKIFFRDHSYDRSIAQLEMAIESMKEIEGDLDEKSNILIEESIVELKMILDEFHDYEVSVDDMNHAYAKALNVLTLAELRVSEALIENEESNNAMLALKYGMYHLKNALQFSAGHKKEYEAHIYDEIDSLFGSSNIPKEKLISRIEFMISELDSLVHDQVKE